MRHAGILRVLVGTLGSRKKRILETQDQPPATVTPPSVELGILLACSCPEGHHTDVCLPLAQRSAQELHTALDSAIPPGASAHPRATLLGTVLTGPKAVQQYTLLVPLTTALSCPPVPYTLRLFSALCAHLRGDDSPITRTCLLFRFLPHVGHSLCPGSSAVCAVVLGVCGASPLLVVCSWGFMTTFRVLYLS